MLNFNHLLLGASLFIPHGHCYLWQPWLVGLHIFADGLIALAYYSIPLTLFYFVRKRQDLPFSWIFLLFSAFIVACGTTHLMEIWTLWHPTYWLSGLIKLLTAAVSIATAILLVLIAPKALALSSPAELEAVNQALQNRIAEQQQIKQMLRSLNERLQYLLTHAPVIIFSCKVNGDYGATSMSENVKTILGYEPQDFLQDSGFWANHIHPEDRDRILAATPQIFEVGHHAHEYRFLHADGEYRWVYNQLQLIRDAAGNPTEMIGYLVDISQRKHTEEALRRYERIVSATTDAISLLDRNYVYQVVNQAYLNWHQKSADAVVGHPVSELLSVEIFETQIKPRLDQCLAGQVIQYEMWVEYPLLGPQFLSVTYDPYLDVNQTITGVVVSLRNITRLKQAEMELELQSIIVNNMAEGVCMIRAADGTIVYTNPKFERMFGYNPGELKGQHVSRVNYEDESISAAVVSQQISEEVAQAGEATYEVYNVRKDGTPFWSRATTSIFQHPQYDTVMVAVQQDITEQKQAAEQITTLREKEVLLKEIHHRVKNNLGIVDGLLQMQSRRSHNSEVVASLKDSQNRIASMALVHEKLYRSEDLANIDFSQYIPDLIAHLFNSYTTHLNNIQLMTRLDDISLDIDTAIPCGLIINELVSNALKYAFPHTSTGEIQVEFHQQPDQHLSLIVRDNGIGFAQDFNPQQSKTLGMSLIQGLVKQLRGTLEINGESGTTVKISFAKGKK